MNLLLAHEVHSITRRNLLVQSKQLKHQNNVLNLPNGSDVFIINFEQISRIILVMRLLTYSKFLIFRRKPFGGTRFLLASNIKPHKFFSNKQPSLKWHCLNYVRRKYGEKRPVSIKSHKLHIFKETVIFLRQSIFKTRRISNLHSLALFAVLWTHVM